MQSKLILIFLSLFLFSCNKTKIDPQPKVFEFNFLDDTEGWQGDFSDLPSDPSQWGIYDLVLSYSNLPAPLNTQKGAIYQSGNNRSDDLFMYIKKQIDSLQPNTTYQLKMTVEFATNAPAGSVGVGGSPAESVFIKAGASTIEPKNQLDELAYYRLNIDKGNQSLDGKNMVLLGNFSNETEESTYRLKSLSMMTPLKVQSDANGSLWLIVGTDSGYEATTSIYYNYIKAELIEN